MNDQVVNKPTAIPCLSTVTGGLSGGPAAGFCRLAILTGKQDSSSY